MTSSRMSLDRLAGVALALLLLGGCKTRLLRNVIVTQTRTTLSCKDGTSPVAKADLLFLIDNSGSMDAMQDELRSRFPQFLQIFHQLAQKGTFVDLHVGVVTSDYGAGRTGSGGGQCSPSPGGQGGRLQKIGQLADPDCKSPTDATFVKYVFAENGDGAHNLPPGQDLDQTFSCMASVGSRGCGYEHQLEAVHAALLDPAQEDAGFLRDDAILVVVFITNEDDCSAPPDSDLFDSNISRYGQQASYRCTRYGVMCGEPPELAPYDDSGGPLAMCVSAPNAGGAGPGKLFDISRYVDMFTKPRAQGGVKVDPSDVLLAAIDAPEKPFQIVLADPHSGISAGQPYTLCPRLDEQSSPQCVPVLQHSCQNALDGAFFGDPAVRLNTVVESAPNHSVASLCDADYGAALEKVAKLIVSQSGQCCFSDPLPNDPREPGNPNAIIASCEVQQVTLNPDGTSAVSDVPECATGVVPPCFVVQMKDQCLGLSPQNLGVTVRHDRPVPPHTSLRASCLSAPTTIELSGT